MRHNQGVSALLISDTVGELVDSSLVYRLYKANSLFLIWIIAQGILGIIENKSTQPEVRNWTFRTFAGTTPLWKRAAFGSKLRYYFVKTIAGVYFVATIACAFVCPFIFVSSVIVNEFNTWSYPVSESEDAVGQVSSPRAEFLLKLTSSSGALGSVLPLSSSPLSSRRFQPHTKRPRLFVRIKFLGDSPRDQG